MEGGAGANQCTGQKKNQGDTRQQAFPELKREMDGRIGRERGRKREQTNGRKYRGKGIELSKDTSI